MSSSCRVAVLATHPIHYQISLFKRLAQDQRIDATMLFCSRFGLSQQKDHTCGVVLQWYDGSILEGCKHEFLTNHSQSPSSVLANIAPAVCREITGARYDVLLVQGYAGVTEWLAIAAARRGSCRVLFRGETALRKRSLLGRAAVRLIMQALSQSVDIFLPVGTRSRDFYLQHGIQPDRLVLSPYAVDNGFFFSQAKQLKNQKHEIRESLGIPVDVPVLLYVSKMIPRKRPLDLLEAFENLHVPAALVFVGDGPLRPEIESRVAQRKLKNVWCVGFQHQHNLAQFYAIGDVFVLPSEYEPWGLVINEAMCFSLPIVTTHGVSSSADLVAHGENGFLYHAGNVEVLRTALRSLVSDVEQRLAMGRRSYEIIQDWDQNASVAGICRGISMALTR